MFLLLVIGLNCDCTTQECMDQKTRLCSGLWCYSETYNGYVETGCLDQRQPLLCENRLSSKLPQHRISHCCNDRDFCNKNVVPTPAPPRNIQGTNCLLLITCIPPVKNKIVKFIFIYKICNAFEQLHSFCDFKLNLVTTIINMYVLFVLQQ